jgi:hypothetical protein
MADLRHFLNLARPLQSSWHLRSDPQDQTNSKGNVMLSVSNIGSRFAAAFSALALSVVLISGTVTMPKTEAAPAQFASAYVGAVA